jgi:hypothetical protein
MSYQTNLLKTHQQLETKLNRLVTSAEGRNAVVVLSQADFTDGTYVISTPGVYRLSETVTFNPNNLAQIQVGTPTATSWDAGGVLPTQLVSGGGSYDDRAYALGFFAAIAITCQDVVIDLNGYTLEQSKEHALLQRFYANIELSDQPFIGTQGPNDFGPKLDKASNCFIVNGTIGRSCHHGIHGNGNNKIFLDNLTFDDFEVAAIALNGAKDVSITNCVVSKSRTDVPVLGTFSAARFLRPYIDKLVEVGYSGVLNAGGVDKTVSVIKDELKTSMNNVHSDIVSSDSPTISKETHLPEWKLFHNAAGVIDGNCYGILTNSLGAAVNGFPNQYVVNKCQNVYMNNVTVNNLKGNIREVLALPAVPTQVNNSYGGGSIQNDPIGAVFQTQNKDADGNWVTATDGITYVGNVVSNAQAMLAKAILEGANLTPLNVSRNSITTATLNWVGNSIPLTDVVNNLEFKCNGDAMFHVNKGVIGFKLDATDYIYMNNCRSVNVSNIGTIGSSLCAADYKNKVGKSHPSATYYGYCGANTRGWSFSSSSHVTLDSCGAVNISSSYGSAYGFDVHQHGNDIEFLNCEATEIHAGNADGNDLTNYQSNPTEFPVAYGFHIHQEVERFTYSKIRSDNLTSLYKKIPCSLNLNHV